MEDELESSFESREPSKPSSASGMHLIGKNAPAGTCPKDVGKIPYVLGKVYIVLIRNIFPILYYLYDKEV